MKRLYVIILFTLVILLTGCAEEPAEYTYQAETFTLDGETLYYRSYVVSTNCDQFDVFPLYQQDGMYYYTESYESMSGACSSGLYVEEDSLYAEVYYSFNTGVFDVIQMSNLMNDIDPLYSSNLTPSEATLALLQAENDVTEQMIIYNHALAIENAAKLYCASTTCVQGEELEYVDLSAYLSTFNALLYDLTANSGIVAEVNSGDWAIYLERVGTGEYEFIAGETPSLTDVSSIIVDTN